MFFALESPGSFVCQRSMEDFSAFVILILFRPRVQRQTATVDPKSIKIPGKNFLNAVFFCSTTFNSLHTSIWARAETCIFLFASVVNDLTRLIIIYYVFFFARKKPSPDEPSKECLKIQPKILFWVSAKSASFFSWLLQSKNYGIIVGFKILNLSIDVCC